MHSYSGFLVKQQPDTDSAFLVFIAKAKEISLWAQADNIKLDRGNVQRALVEARWRQVRKFFKSSKNNVIPTSVTIAFDDTIQKLNQIDQLVDEAPGFVLEQGPGDLWTLTFTSAVKSSCFIIDGQHRLKGMSQLDFDIEVPVCLFVKMSKLERAFQFVTINNKSHKVPTDNLKALIANFEQIQSDLRSRLTHASITVPRFATAIDVLNEDEESPFYKMIDWVNNRFPDAKAIVPPTAVENSLKAISRAFPETREDESDALAILYSIWRTIFAPYAVTHETAEHFPNLMLKATIQSLSEMIIEKLKADFDPAFSDSVITDNGASAGQVAAGLIKGLPIQFWQVPWKLKSLDTSAGRDIIQSDIRALKKTLMANSGVLPENWMDSLSLYKSGLQLDE